MTSFQRSPSHQQVIDLGVSRDKGVIVLSGRPKGVKLRERFRLDDLDAGSQEVIVRIPHEILSVNSSFFLGLFANSIRKLGRKGFFAKYHFDSGNQVQQDIEDGIRLASIDANPIPPVESPR